MNEENPLAYPLDNGNYELIWWRVTEDWLATFTDSKDRFMLPVFVGGEHIGLPAKLTHHQDS